jgi:hypothetical protein
MKRDVPLSELGTLPPPLSQLEKVIKIINELYKEADLQFFYLLLEVLFFSCGPLRASKHIRANVFPLAENKLEKLRSYYAALT